FHFQGSSVSQSNPAGWRCDECRRRGLEEKRRCGWIPEERRGARRIVWARGRTAAEECPKSFVTPQSVEGLEKFFAWKLGGGGSIEKLAARDTDAFLILEREWRTGLENGQQ